jgi:hypothetical protein
VQSGALFSRPDPKFGARHRSQAAKIELEKARIDFKGICKKFWAPFLHREITRGSRESRGEKKDDDRGIAASKLTIKPWAATH